VLVHKLLQNVIQGYGRSLFDVVHFSCKCFGEGSEEHNCICLQFGHALQHLLTKTSYMEVSGLSNVEWDAVEVCSTFMVHW
jgi:hypothetical protein